jgi:ABC-type glycerol-3-phosphate transport system substrate-binding protein
MWSFLNDPVVGWSEEDFDDAIDRVVDADINPFTGYLLGLSPNKSIEVLYYNADALAEMGYDGPPETWEEFYNMACDYTDEEAGTVGFEYSTDASALAAVAFSMGTDVYDYEENEFNYNQAETVEALEWLQKMAEDGCARPPAERYGDQTDFGAEITIFTTSSTSGIRYYHEALKAAESDFTWDLAPYPHPNTEEPVLNLYGGSISLIDSSPAKELASWLFLRWMLEGPQQARWSEATGYMSLRSSVREGVEVFFEDWPQMETALNLIAYSQPEPNGVVPGYDQIRGQASGAFAAIYDGAEIEPTLADLDETANEILEDNLENYEVCEY